MSIKYNNTTLSAIKYNNTELDKIIYNTTTVYQRITVNYYCENSVYRSVKVVSGNSVSLSSANAASKSGWSFLGWRLDKTASSSVQSSITAGTSTINLYAVYRQTITLSYNGNGNTGGSTASQSGYRYYNNGNVVNPTFTIRSNGFSKSGYKFVNWRLNSTSGTVYNPNATISLSSNATLYAMWTVVYVQSTYTILQGRTQIDSTQGIVNFPTFEYNHTITGNTISINSPGKIVANTRCSVKFTARFMCENVDGQSVNCAIYLYKNNSVLYTLFGPADCGAYKDVLIGFSGHPYFGYSVTLEKGETLNYRVAAPQRDGSANARVNFYPKGQTSDVGLTQFIATPL